MSVSVSRQRAKGAGGPGTYIVYPLNGTKGGGNRCANKGDCLLENTRLLDQDVEEGLLDMDELGNRQYRA
jgi:hypothetical protein